ncbi:MAG: hypothetical protein EXQ87_09040 [Alphaproteobacteria bacterium]|nr:hypothetical protein [Alphaproteobacteria bacterium]
MRPEAAEIAVLENIVPELEAEGFDVYTRPSPHLLPAFMHGHSPDAIALRPDKKLAIEVLREGPQAKQRFDMAQKLLSGHDEWELRVYWISSSTIPKMIEAAPRRAIEETIETVQELARDGRAAPALLMAWATLEALGRGLLPGEFANPQTPRRLVEVLASQGYIAPSDADRLRPLAETRNRLIHGGLQKTVRTAELKSFITILKTLLSLLPKS